MKRLTITLLAALLGGCAIDQPNQQDGAVTRVGFLSQVVLQHPMVMLSPPVENDAGNLNIEEVEQFYFDVGDKPDPGRQILVHSDAGLKWNCPRKFSM